jgi:hypothetical protein
MICAAVHIIAPALAAGLRMAGCHAVGDLLAGKRYAAAAKQQGNAQYIISTWACMIGCSSGACLTCMQQLMSHADTGPEGKPWNSMLLAGDNGAKQWPGAVHVPGTAE